MANYKLCDADRLDADLSIVADAIRAKGGTSAKLEFPSGYKAAVEAISGGGNTEKKGSLTTNSSGMATVDCGFQPDIVWFSINHKWQDISFEAAVDFVSSSSSKIACTDLYDDDKILAAVYIVQRTATGFTLEAGYRDYNYGEGELKNQTITYTAKKYT